MGKKALQSEKKLYKVKKVSKKSENSEIKVRKQYISLNIQATQKLT